MTGLASPPESCLNSPANVIASSSHMSLVQFSPPKYVNPRDLFLNEGQPIPEIDLKRSNEASWVKDDVNPMSSADYDLSVVVDEDDPMGSDEAMSSDEANASEELSKDRNGDNTITDAKSKKLPEDSSERKDEDENMTDAESKKSSEDSSERKDEDENMTDAESKKSSEDLSEDEDEDENITDAELMKSSELKDNKGANKQGVQLKKSSDSSQDADGPIVNLQSKKPSSDLIEKEDEPTTISSDSPRDREGIAPMIDLQSKKRSSDLTEDGEGSTVEEEEEPKKSSDPPNSKDGEENVLMRDLRSKKVSSDSTDDGEDDDEEEDEEKDESTKISPNDKEVDAMIGIESSLVSLQVEDGNPGIGPEPTQMESSAQPAPSFELRRSSRNAGLKKKPTVDLVSSHKQFNAKRKPASRNIDILMEASIQITQINNS